jgi:hypothetical protein
VSTGAECTVVCFGKGRPPAPMTVGLKTPLRVAAAAAVLAVAAPPASLGSELIDRRTSSHALRVNGDGQALVTWRAGGRPRHVVAWGAIDARHPTRRTPQVSFRLDYSRRSIRAGRCGRYDGPPLAWLVRACKAPDGSYWALQRWQRIKANYGGRRGTWELRLSHWSGPLAQLAIWTDWAYRRYDHLYGRFTFRGRPVHGFRSTSRGRPVDAYGRNIYVDTLGSRYGRGWRRENSFLARRPKGAFCYGFYPHGSRPAGKGSRYRATVVGPGVTPDVMWEGPAPGRFDRGREVNANAHQRSVFADGRPGGCRPR